MRNDGEGRTPPPSATEIARELVAMPTVNPPGNEAPAQRYLLSLLEASGLPVDLVEKEPNRPNLVTRLPGSGERPPLLFHGHVDVVGVDGQQWRLPPFGAIVEDEILHGRGALDMKGGVAMLTHALLRAHADGLRPGGDMVLLVVADEEAGGGAGMGYLLDQHPEIFSDAEHAIGEFGGFPLYLFNRKFYRIGVSQKQYAHVLLRLEMPGGHGSQPTTSTVMGKLGRVLSKLDQGKLSYHRAPVVEQIIESICRVVPEESSAILRRLLDPEQFDETLAELGPHGSTLESLFRDTANPTIVKSGTKFNVIPSQAHIELDTRILPGRTTHDAISHIRRLIDDPDVTIEILASGPPTKSGVDYRLFSTLEAVLRHLDPEGVPIPYLFNESPDGRLLDAHGIQNHGFLPMDLPPDLDLPRLIHAPDERVPLDAITFGADALYELISRY